MIQEAIPFNPAYDDWYFSPGSGYAESRYVFFEGNDLRTRICPTLRIGEIGFGTGLNLWVLLHELARLGYGSLEFRTVDQAPPAPEVVQVLLSPYSQELGGAEEFSQYLIFYKRLTSNPQKGWSTLRVNFLGISVEISLWIGEASDMVADLENRGWKADGWFLDGHDPKRNPGAWDFDLLKGVGRATKIGGTLATYSAAGIVKTRLREAGFEVRRRKGFGKKHHMVQGRYLGLEGETLLSKSKGIG